MLAPQLGELARIAKARRVGERPLDLFGTNERRRKSIAERQGAPASARLLRELLTEPLDAARRVDEALLARVERVALRADVGVNLRLRRTSLECIAAGALHSGRGVLGMDVGFHDEPLIDRARDDERGARSRHGNLDEPAARVEYQP
jgi:hypothetical protein